MVNSRNIKEHYELGGQLGTGACSVVRSAISKVPGSEGEEVSHMHVQLHCELQLNAVISGTSISPQHCATACFWFDCYSVAVAHYCCRTASVLCDSTISIVSRAWV